MWLAQNHRANKYQHQDLKKGKEKGEIKPTSAYDLLNLVKTFKRHVCNIYKITFILEKQQIQHSTERHIHVQISLEIQGLGK